MLETWALANASVAGKVCADDLARLCARALQSNLGSLGSDVNLQQASPSCCAEQVRQNLPAEFCAGWCITVAAPLLAPGFFNLEAGEAPSVAAPRSCAYSGRVWCAPWWGCFSSTFSWVPAAASDQAQHGNCYQDFSGSAGLRLVTACMKLSVDELSTLRASLDEGACPRQELVDAYYIQARIR